VICLNSLPGISWKRSTTSSKANST